MGCDINTIVEVLLEDNEIWCCAGSVDHLIHRNKTIFSVLGNVWNIDGIPYIAENRLVWQSVLTEDDLSFLKNELQQVNVDYPCKKSDWENDLKDMYASCLQSRYGINQVFIDLLINNWGEKNSHNASFVTLQEMLDYDYRQTYWCTYIVRNRHQDGSILSLSPFQPSSDEKEKQIGEVQIFEMIKGGTRSWLGLIEFISNIGKLYGQIDPKKIRLCFFFDS